MTDETLAQIGYWIILGVTYVFVILALFTRSIAFAVGTVASGTALLVYMAVCTVGWRR